MTFDQGGTEEPTQPSDTESGTSPQSLPTPELSAAGPPARPPKRLRNSLVAGGLVAIGALAVKVALGLFVVSVAGHVLGAVFGGPYQRLPENVRSGLEQRLDAALNHQLDGLSDTEQKARLEALIRGGLPRLDDTTLMTHFRLQFGAIENADASTCAAYSRTDFAGTKPAEDVSVKLVGLLDDADLRQWFEINVEAIEAEANKSPASRTATSAEAGTAITTAFQGIPAADQTTVQSMLSGTTVTDAAACSAERSINRAASTLPPSDFALIARYIVSQ